MLSGQSAENCSAHIVFSTFGFVCIAFGALARGHVSGGMRRQRIAVEILQREFAQFRARNDDNCLRKLQLLFDEFDQSGSPLARDRQGIDQIHYLRLMMSVMENT